MSAEVLREAAAQIRNDHGGVVSRNTLDGRRWLPVADWLEAEATAHDSMAVFSQSAAKWVREENFTIRGAALTISQRSDGSLAMTADTSGPALAVARAYLGREL